MTKAFVYLGQILGRAYIVNDAPFSLISTSLMTKKGLEVAFNDKRLKITDTINNRVLYRKRVNAQGLYEMDLPAFLQMKIPQNFNLRKDANRLANLSYTPSTAPSGNPYDSDAQQNSDTDVDNGEPHRPNGKPDFSDADICQCFQANLKWSENKTSSDSDDSLHTQINDDTIDINSLGVNQTVFDDELTTTILTPPRQKRTRNHRVSQDLAQRILWLHKCMSHPGREAMATAVENNSWLGIDKDITGATILVPLAS